MTLTESNQRQKAYAVLYGSLFAIFIIGAVLIALLPRDIAGFPSGYLVFILAVFAWFTVLMRYVPRCPNCGLGYFSMVEVGRFPVIAKSWVGSHCYGCGKELK
jgi:hypothetical protein